VTNFVNHHPGGPIIVASLGCDATAEFENSGHSAHARDILETLHIGRLVMSS
jgi:cytochrome b involved in lipid metabolism